MTVGATVPWETRRRPCGTSADGHRRRPRRCASRSGCPRILYQGWDTVEGTAHGGSSGGDARMVSVDQLHVMAFAGPEFLGPEAARSRACLMAFGTKGDPQAGSDRQLGTPDRRANLLAEPLVRQAPRRSGRRPGHRRWGTSEVSGRPAVPSTAADVDPWISRRGRSSSPQIGVPELISTAVSTYPQELSRNEAATGPTGR
jgi:hypothetical protein